MSVVTPADMNAPQHIGANGAPPQEAPQAPIEEAPKKTEIMSPQFAALARKERELRHQAQQLKAEREAFKLRETEIQSQAQSEWKQRLASNPWDVLLEAGLTPEQATNLIINQPQPKDIEFQNLQREFKALQAAHKQAEENAKAQTTQNYEQAKKQIDHDVKLLVDSTSDYETIKEMSAQSAVTELIEKTYQQDGYIMSIEDAAKEVEDYLLEEALRLTKLKKIQSRLTPTQDIPESNLTQKPNTQSPTLTNRLNPTSKALDAKQRRERAILAFQGKL